MGDIRCRVCGEPWDAYGVYHGGDLDEKEKKIFLAGKGCPCCKGVKPQGSNPEKLEENFLFSLTEETDSDPIELLDNYLEAQTQKRRLEK